MNIFIYLPKFIQYMCMPIDAWESPHSGVTGGIVTMATVKTSHSTWTAGYILKQWTNSVYVVFLLVKEKETGSTYSRVELRREKLCWMLGESWWRQKDISPTPAMPINPSPRPAQAILVFWFTPFQTMSLVNLWV